MNLLAIDSAAKTLSAALSRGDDYFYAEADAQMKQSELVMEFIDSLMKKASLKPDDLNGVLCMSGPGSFTGLRIGYSVAKGLALSLSIPFVPVPTLDCIAYQLTDNSEVNAHSSLLISRSSLQLAVIEARKNACFYAFFRGGERLTPDVDADFSQIAEEISRFNEKIVLSGPGSFLLFDSLPDELKEIVLIKNENRGYAREIILIAKALNLFDKDNTAYLFSGPEYLRKTDAVLSLEC